jgi:uncharacterized phage protein (TIGR02220 family)
MKKSILLYQDQKEVFDTLTDEQAGKLIKAIFQYQENGEFILADPLLKIIMIPIRQAIDRNSDKYDAVCKRNAENIAKRWNKDDTKNTSGINGIPNDTKNTNNDSDSDSDNDSDNKRDSNKNKKEDKSSYSDLLSFLNSTTNKSFKVVTSKADKNIKSRIKDGFTIDDVKKAIINCSKNKYHIENPQYLTLEFITRADNLEKYLNAAPTQMIPLRPHDKGFNPVSYSNVVN